MATLTNESQKDLEKCAWNDVGRHEEEKVQLLEDSTMGKLTYFFFPYFSQNMWMDILISLIYTLLPLSAQLMYFFLCEIIYHGFQKDLSHIFCAPWLIIHYFLYHAVFFVDYIYCKATVSIGTNSLQKLLEEVAEIDLAGDPEAWRKIAFKVNCSFAEDKYRKPVFYGGEQCRRFFVREFLRPIKSESYYIAWFTEERLIKTYCEDESNRMLAEQAIANYKKSIDGFDDLFEIDRKEDRTDRLFERFHNIAMTMVLCLGLIGLASFLFMILAVIVIPICYSVFNAIFHTSPTYN
ncbi:hypothetical protein BZL39_A09770 [Zygosaccharomyces parabailii]|nr:hypothetical protein BZL39_A09770 [Zygosaccharomyces parabailii]CDH12285.1 uncharacterized protein ZBAI_04071 [Zygosaccharomyces bailii ISA1307]